VRLILASASLRRAELLSAAGFEFDVVPADVDETPHPNESPRDYVLRVARAKAAHVVAMTPEPDRPVLAADTTVVAGGRLMGKPKDANDALAMLRLLAGAVHEVHTAVVIEQRRRRADRVVTTRVEFQPMTEAEIAWYLGTGEPFGKAGAYGIQGRAARFIERIEGSWSNVVGLPISTVYRLLEELGEVD
jgi:nucleoside triphosphate pyrophosphatase